MYLCVDISGHQRRAVGGLFSHHVSSRDPRWQQVPLPAEPSHWLLISYFRTLCHMTLTQNTSVYLNVRHNVVLLEENIGEGLSDL